MVPCHHLVDRQSVHHGRDRNNFVPFSYIRSSFNLKDTGLFALVIKCAHRRSCAAIRLRIQAQYARIALFHEYGVTSLGS